MANKILFKRSNVLNSDGSVKTPSVSSLDYGEITVNYNDSHEVFSIKNNSNEIVTFSSDKDIDTLDEAPTNGTLMSKRGVPYKIGDKVRVSDENEKIGYKLYRLIDKTSEGNAVWEVMYSDELMKPYYIYINQDITDPYKMISSGGTREVIEWIRNNSHRYLGKYVSGDDMMYLCQLNDFDSARFSDNGSSAVLFGLQGDVFMKLPKFYYKAEKIASTDYNWKIGFSTYQVDETWKCWQGNDLIGAFEGFYEDGKLRSIRTYNETSTEISYSDCKKYAVERYGNNHGKLVTWEQHCIMCFLFYAYYLHTDSQSQCGSGLTYNASISEKFSMVDTTYESAMLCVNFWGLENWWGHKAEWVDNASGGTNVFMIKPYSHINGEYSSNTREVLSYRNNDYFAHMTIGDNLDVTPLDSKLATSTSGYCDQIYNNGSKYIVDRSGNDSSPSLGVASSAAILDGRKTQAVTSRLCYVGPWQELSSDEFKTIESFS